MSRPCGSGVANCGSSNAGMNFPNGGTCAPGTLSAAAAQLAGLLVAGSATFVNLARENIAGSLVLMGTSIDPLSLNVPGPLSSEGAPIPFQASGLVNVQNDGGGVLRYTGPITRILEINVDLSYRLLFHDVGFGIAINGTFQANSETLVNADSSGSDAISVHVTSLVSPGDRIEIFWVERGTLVPTDPAWFLLSAHLSVN